MFRIELVFIEAWDIGDFPSIFKPIFTGFVEGEHLALWSFVKIAIEAMAIFQH